jgi:hypothetical protein
MWEKGGVMSDEKICPLLWIAASVTLISIDKNLNKKQKEEVADGLQTIGTCQEEKCRLWYYCGGGWLEDLALLLTRLR